MDDGRLTRLDCEQAPDHRVRNRPGVARKEPVERLVMGTDVVGYHLRKLVREDKIVREKKSRTRVYHPVKK